MKKVLLPLFLFGILVSSLALPVKAQTEAELEEQVTANSVIQDVEGLRLELIQKTQDPANKDIQFELKINPQISSDRVQLSWLIDGQSVFKEGVATENLVVSPNNTVTKTITITPAGYGLTKVSAVVEAYQIDGTRVATASKTIATDANGRLLFSDGSEQTARILYYVRLVAVALLVIFLLVVGGYVGYRLFRGWLSNDKL